MYDVASFWMNSDIIRTLVYPQPWHILKPWYIQNPVKYIRWSISFRTPCNFSIFRLLINSKPLHIQNSRHSKYCESLKYSLHWTLCNLVTFTHLVYSSPSIRIIQGILKILSKMYDGLFSTALCVELAYSELETYS